MAAPVSDSVIVPSTRPVAIRRARGLDDRWSAQALNRELTREHLTSIPKPTHQERR
eukprot:CAMPEP_0116545590 /NCGR_PEP_ID=MMETSP0397-20121206/2753_1 /TAXON_ID=216820 /ORGANISM="Cyclophora tenuis, Strain ECT3854" /LENGTH=55 /DNA_ID=CAMNT_0004069921 /DNA_START=362 /DNA_END=529 /DNA_ORIENTATION=-